MQSQQKRVKWSRGETAEALEERTDTGITQASVELMENCIPDIYGNISRRPGLSLMTRRLLGGTPDIAGFVYDKYLQVIPFYISETDIILVGIHYDRAPEFIRITDGQYAGYVSSTALSYPKTSYNSASIGSVLKYKQVSFAQQNNYMLIADNYNVWKLQFSFGVGTFTPSLDVWRFTAGWYAPNGTQTKEVTNQTVPQLNVSGSFENYTYTDSTGNSTVYSYTDTGVSAASLNILINEIPVGSIIQLPKIGTYFRLEGFTVDAGSQNILAFTEIEFDGVLAVNASVPSSGKYCQPVETAVYGRLKAFQDGMYLGDFVCEAGTTYVVRNVGSTTGYSAGHFNKNSLGQTSWQGWSDFSVSSLHAYMFGSLLVPVADKNATDSRVVVEYGYISLTPSQYTLEASFPHPTELTFLDQRLWAGDWHTTATESYAIVLGSQIARYNDLKNDYNQENEPITIDILTQFKENIVHLIDYNGLKIMTNSFEYAYQDGAVVKQSANGSLENCEPLVFDSLCLYVDSTGQQIKAMQYELQANIFNSSTINQLASHDLVWYPLYLAAYEDKINSTGKYLFVLNSEATNIPRIAVCNFVPSNQANIWSRWAFKDSVSVDAYTSGKFLHSIVHTKKEPIFMVTLQEKMSMYVEPALARICPAIINFDAQTDLGASVYVDTLTGANYYSPALEAVDQKPFTLANTEVAVYSNGEFKWIETTDDTGKLSAAVQDLENVTIGMPINATVRSHPIDVGGKTKSIKKRIGKTVMSVHDTEAGAITINDKTGYMNPRGDKISFYGVTGMKDEIKYTLTNKNGAMFHLESLLMNIEYGTLDS